jgi:hypothetical protein
MSNLDNVINKNIVGDLTSRWVNRKETQFFYWTLEFSGSRLNTHDTSVAIRPWMKGNNTSKLPAEGRETLIFHQHHVMQPHISPMLKPLWTLLQSRQELSRPAVPKMLGQLLSVLPAGEPVHLFLGQVRLRDIPQVVANQGVGEKINKYLPAPASFPRTASILHPVGFQTYLTSINSNA